MRFPSIIVRLRALTGHDNVPTSSVVKRSTIRAESPTRCLTSPAPPTPPSPVAAVLLNSRKHELEQISLSLTERLRRVCAHMSDKDFKAMIRRMADVQWRSEQRPQDPDRVDFVRVVRGNGSR